MGDILPPVLSHPKIIDDPVPLASQCKATEPFVDVLRSKLIETRFVETLQGYHLLNDTPVKEAVWETINASVVKNVCNIDSIGNGNHLSGRDMVIDGHGISNKTSCVKNGVVSLSSYRLTNVCNIKNHGDIFTIVAEIERRDESFEYYSILLREIKEDHLVYQWVVIPKNHPIFVMDPSSWAKKFSKRGKCTGWTSRYASIHFSMSSQLWFKFRIKEIREFIVQQVSISRSQMGCLSYKSLLRRNTTHRQVQGSLVRLIGSYTAPHNQD